MQFTLAIRNEVDADLEAIRQVHLQAFPTDLEARLVDELRQAGRLTLSLVAVLDNQVVGHLALSPVTIEEEPIGLGLAPVAMASERQNQGGGGALIRQALAQCRLDEVPLVVVLGEPQYYSRFGFVPASPLGLQDSYEGGENFQVVLLSGDQPLRKGPLRKGLVNYAPEFALFE